MDLLIRSSKQGSWELKLKISFSFLCLTYSSFKVADPLIIACKIKETFSQVNAYHVSTGINLSVIKIVTLDINNKSIGRFYIAFDSINSL